MSLLTRPLRTLDDARRVAELVYSTYGLTYHRRWMYDAERLLELNRRHLVASMMAVEPGGRVLGHIAAIRPLFEIENEAERARAAPVVEVGLSIVHPEGRGRQVQASMAMALLMQETAEQPGLRGAFMKCVTTHTRSQRSARHFLGRAVALNLGGVPAWVVCDGSDRTARGPITTIVLHCALGPRGEAVTVVPEGEEEPARRIFAEVGLRRRVVAVPRGRARDEGPCELRTAFDPARRQGTVRVVRPGADLVEAVVERTRWLIEGHMEHITVLLPLATPGVAAAVPELKEAGLFVGGFLPDFAGVDTLVMQVLKATNLDPDGIELVGNDALYLRDRVVQNWRSCRPLPRARPA